MTESNTRNSVRDRINAIVDAREKREAATRPQPAVKEVEPQIEKLEAEITEMETKMSEDSSEAMKLLSRYEAAKHELDTAMEKWETLSDELSKL